MSLAIVAPTTREARAVGPECQVTGTGKQGEQRLAEILREQKPTTVLITGLCGGLDPSLGPGDLILAREVFQEDGVGLKPPEMTVTSARRALRKGKTRFVCSGLVTVEAPAATPGTKLELWNIHGAAGVDMETASFARVAMEQGVDWIALRAVIDPAAMSLPRTIHDWNGQESDLAIALRLARQPHNWLASGRLLISLRSALKSLRLGTPIVARVARDTVPLGDDLLA